MMAIDRMEQVISTSRRAGRPWHGPPHRPPVVKREEPVSRQAMRQSSIMPLLKHSGLIVASIIIQPAAGCKISLQSFYRPLI